MSAMTNTDSIIGPVRQSQQDLSDYVPPELLESESIQTAIPAYAKNPAIVEQIEQSAQHIETAHQLLCQDSRCDWALPDDSVHLVLTSPPYWTLKKYRDGEGQLGDISDYSRFLDELDTVWRHCYRVFVPGGRLICVVGDVCLSRRKNDGRHTVVPLHASIQERCRIMGFDNVAPIIWHKIANATYEVEGGTSFLGKPYEPNAVIKNDIEFILMERKPGGYRKPSTAKRILSLISEENHRKWFQQIWTGVTGASTRSHPAPYPIELAERLVRMFSFVGDVVLDPFAGTGTTTLAAAQWGRNSISLEVDPQYHKFAQRRIREAIAGLFRTATLSTAGD